MDRSLRLGEALPELVLRDHADRPWSTQAQLGRPLVLVLHRHLA